MFGAMTWLRIVTIIAVVATSSAVARADEKRDEISQADGEKVLAFFNKFVDAVVANKDHCPQMAKAINTVIDANTDTIKMANEAKAKGKKLPQAIEDKMMARVKEMMPAMRKCGGDKDVKDATKRLEAKSDKSENKSDKAEK